MSASKRKRLRDHLHARDAVMKAWEARGYSYPPPSFPPMPSDLASMACEAKTKAGTPCKLKAIYANGRCKFHGGLSTGPKTEAGKEQARINGMCGGRPRAKPKS